MKFEKTELVSKLNMVKDFVPKKPYNAALGGVLVEKGKMVANNLDSSIIADIEAEGDEPIVIPASAFGLIGSLPNGTVEITNDGTGILIKAARIRNRFAAHPADMFTRPDDEASEEVMRIQAETLFKALKRGRFALPRTDATMQTMNCLHLKSEGGDMTITALDGHVMAESKMKCDKDFEMLIPKESVYKFLSVGLDGEVAVCKSEKTVSLRGQGCELRSMLVSGAYFDTKNLHFELPLRADIARDDLLDSLNRAMVSMGNEVNSVRLTFDEGALAVRANTNTVDYAEEIALLNNPGERVEIGFSARLLMEALKSFDSGDIELSFGDSRSPMVIGQEGDDYSAMVLPVLLR